MSFAFDEAYYLKSKLQQLIKTDAATYGSWSTDDVKDAIEAAGMTVEGHYHQYSLVEGTSANPYFNTTEYLEAKLAQLKSVDPAQYNNWTVADVVKAFQDAGFTSAEDHYNQYGCKETDATGHLINPSNAFDANAYVQAKLAQLVAADPETYGEWTAADVAEAIADAGMSPVEHFEEYGKAEGQAAGIDMVQTVPVTQRVANDDLRDGMNENVPSNYNKPVDAPKDVTAAEAAENGGVDKPCDMATTTDKPADPVATPADSDYVAVPGGGITDTNENPVELVTAEVKDTEGNTVASASEYGVATTTKDADGNTVKTVQPVDENGAVDAEADPIQTVTTSADGKTQNTETKVTDADGNTVELKEEVTTASDGTTTTKTEATATDADGNQTAKTESTVTEDAEGNTTSDVTYTDENGKTTETKTDAEGNTETEVIDEGGSSSGGSTNSGSGGEVDTTPPTISKVEVTGTADAEGNIASYDQVKITFSEKVLFATDESTTQGAITLTSGALDNTIAALITSTDVSSAVLSSDGLTYTISLKTPLDAGETAKIKVAAGAFKDASANAMAATATAVESDPVPVSGDITATKDANLDALVVSGQADDNVFITALSQTEGVKVGDTVKVADATVSGTVTASNVDAKAVDAGENIVTINMADSATTAATAASSSFSTTVLNLVADKKDQVTIANGSVEKTLVDNTNFGTDDSYVQGTFTIGKVNNAAIADGFTVTDGKITLDNTNSTYTLESAASGTGAFAGKVNMATVELGSGISFDAAATLDTLKVADGATVALGENASFTEKTTGDPALTLDLNAASGTSAITLSAAQLKSFGGLSGGADDSITLNDTSASSAFATTALDVKGFAGILDLGKETKVQITTSDTTNAATIAELKGAALTDLTLDASTKGITLTKLSGASDGVALTVKGTNAVAVTESANTDKIASITGTASEANVVTLTTVTGETDTLAVTMGTGADQVTLSGERGVATITVAAGDSLSATSALTDNTDNNVATADIYTGIITGDIIKTGLTFSAETNAATSALSGVTDDGLAIVKGTYTAGTSKFTAGSAAGDDDYLLEWADGTNIHAVVLVGITGTSVTAAASTTGDITITVA